MFRYLKNDLKTSVWVTFVLNEFTIRICFCQINIYYYYLQNVLTIHVYCWLRIFSYEVQMDKI